MQYDHNVPTLIGQSPVFLKAMERVTALGKLQRPLLILGERGVGKDLAARRAHFLSPRWNHPYIQVNGAALSDELLASELFGHEAGSFTGATKRRAGRFERAEGGSLFLDEIADVSLKIQESLLRILEYGDYERLGGDETLQADVRIIAATNADMGARVREGKFRADLLDRLSFDVVTLPPLRERREDIPLLAEYFAEKITAELGEALFPGFTPHALEQLHHHAWPGNIREFKHTIERNTALHLLEQSISEPLDQIDLVLFDLSHTPPRAGWAPHKTDTPVRPEPAAPLKEDHLDFYAQTDRFSTRLLREALTEEKGHQGRAAQRLGLTYHQFRGLARKYNLIGQKTDNSKNQKP